ncbi:hypothetical protein ACQEWB_47645 [Streptomyces sp. CA-249302]|uniref:hypothetical protein n=1 Tax=Streptomyces sp. CA-249302 TaxID=3240058 RepID=UPI003D8E398C
MTVSTDLNISGRLAQFGSGMIKEISEKLFTQFVENVESRLLGPATAPEEEEEETPPAPEPEEAPAGEPLDLMRLAGGSVYRRLVPALVVVVVVVAVVVLLLAL